MLRRVASLCEWVNDFNIYGEGGASFEPAGQNVCGSLFPVDRYFPFEGDVG